MLEDVKRLMTLCEYYYDEAHTNWADEYAWHFSQLGSRCEDYVIKLENGGEVDGDTIEQLKKQIYNMIDKYKND